MKAKQKEEGTKNKRKQQGERHKGKMEKRGKNTNFFTL